MIPKRGVAKFVVPGVVLLLGAFGSVPVVMINARQHRQAEESPRWPTAQGTVVSSSLDHHVVRNNEYWYVRARYTYAVDGTSYQRGAVGLDDRNGEFDNEADARALSARLPVGATVPVYYDPASPGWVSHPPDGHGV